MKRIISHLTLFVTSLLLALAIAAYGYYEQKTAQAANLFLALDFDSADVIYQDLDQKISKLGIISNIVPQQWKKEIKVKKAEIKYWQKNFGALLNQDNSKSEKEDPELTFLRSSSSYRNVEGERNKSRVLRAVGNAITGYNATIKSDSENINAVFNYEYLLQLRNNIARDKKQLPLKNKPGQGGKDSQLDDNQGIHGQVGRPAKESGGKPTIKILVPLDEDEAGKKEGGKDAGKGDVQRRKG